MEKRIQRYIQEHRDDIVNDVVRLVKKEAPSSDIEGLNEVREELFQLIEERLELRPEVIETASGRHVLYTQAMTGDQPIVLMGHYDTVHPAGKLPVVLEEDVLKGPGVLDMKAGLVQGIWACKALCELGLKTDHPVHLMYNGDEEIGSRDSKEILQTKAKQALCALILEPGVENGDVKTGRKGAMSCTMVIHGKASHAGNHPEEGINAILEMAHQIIALQKLNDNELGTTVNVGKITGGTVSNVVPDRAEVEIDLRYKTIQEKQRIKEAIEAIPLFVSGTNRELSFSDGSNPLEESAGNMKLFELAQESAERFDLPMGHQFVGGASDGNRISHLGLPILDGLGAVGRGIHALDEQISLDLYLKRIEMLILFLTKINRSKLG